MLEVIGLGFGRTGTLSLKQALQILGYSPCHHFSSLYRVRRNHHWQHVSYSDNPDWPTLLHGYRASTDWPVAAFPDSLYQHYPNARYILTVRDHASWYDSVNESIYQLRLALPTYLPGFKRISEISDQIIWQGTFHNKFDDRQYAISQLSKHEQYVRSLIPKDQLLIFNVREGWGPLCHFLNVPEPIHTPFPSTNRRIALQWIVKFLKWLPWIGGASIILILLIVATLTEVI